MDLKCVKCVKILRIFGSHRDISYTMKNALTVVAAITTIAKRDSKTEHAYIVYEF